MSEWDEGIRFTAVGFNPPKSRVRFVGMEPLVYLQFVTPPPRWWFHLWQRWMLGLIWEKMP